MPEKMRTRADKLAARAERKRELRSDKLSSTWGAMAFEGAGAGSRFQAGRGANGRAASSSRRNPLCPHAPGFNRTPCATARSGYDRRLRVGRNADSARDLAVALPEGDLAGEVGIVGRRLEVAVDVEGSRRDRVLAGRRPPPFEGPEPPGEPAARARPARARRRTVQLGRHPWPVVDPDLDLRDRRAPGGAQDRVAPAPARDLGRSRLQTAVPDRGERPDGPAVARLLADGHVVARHEAARVALVDDLDAV